MRPGEVAGVKALAASKHLRRLAHHNLNNHYTALGEAGFAALAESPVLDTVRWHEPFFEWWDQRSFF